MSTNETRYSVVRAFQRGEYERAGNFYSSGDALHTYNVCLAYRGKDGEIYFTEAMGKKFSTTTSAHQGAIREVLGVRPVGDGSNR